MKPIKVMQKLNESENNSFESQLKSVFNNVKSEPEYKGYEIDNSGLCVSDTCTNFDGDYVDGFSFYTINNVVIPNVDGSSMFDIQAPRYIKDKNGVDYGDYISFEGPIDINKIKSVFDELNSKKKTINPEDRDENGYSRIVEQESDEIDNTENNDIKSLANSIETILHNCNADISYVDSYNYNDRKDLYEIQISCRFRPDKLSKYDNDIKLYGQLFFDKDLKLTKSDLTTSSGPNVLNYDFAKALNALYSYFASGNQHYDM